LKKIDFYILKKFLGTFFFAITLILAVAVIFDITEKIDNFMEKGAPLKAIVFDYYKNFIPYFANLFTPLFVFIAVIFFTSKMAYNSEIIAILSSGVSFRRLMYPYFLGALFISIFSFWLGGYVIPPANVVRLRFETRYVDRRHETKSENIHMQIEPGVFVYIGNYYSYNDKGDYFNLEKFDGNVLKSKLSARSIRYDSITGGWTLRDYTIREMFDDGSQKISSGRKKDTLISIKPNDFKEEKHFYEMMNNDELNDYIEEQKRRGVGNVEAFVIEKYRRIANPFAAFILTLIGVSLASRKIRGGMGLHIGIGISLSFAYIMFMTISTTFAISGSMSPLLAVWLPNIVFALIGVVLYNRAPK
jgi:lipopolysaccharide export system permease protein